MAAQPPDHAPGEVPPLAGGLDIQGLLRAVQQKGVREEMRVLVACEFSGIVREAFRAKGHDA